MEAVMLGVMHFYRKHYKLTSLILLSLTLACLGYVQEKVFIKLNQHLTENNLSHIKDIKSKIINSPTTPSLKCYYLIAKKTIIDY